eukprot:NODE_2968_length_1450_cov_48.972118_g2573_i0.p1 GENE.NODE_2968_length_1450_cov_48.972118_g2573_i0~~NODE_2968_length_1450_cov_48.972118_g2573_i0.p1  ORF type:complete len:464 (+),score=69.06 NODE_2968_length_1450_cov_48.972118_g2573_i0:58-1392(+)
MSFSSIHNATINTIAPARPPTMISYGPFEWELNMDQIKELCSKLRTYLNEKAPPLGLDVPEPAKKPRSNSMRSIDGYQGPNVSPPNPIPSTKCTPAKEPTVKPKPKPEANKIIRKTKDKNKWKRLYQSETQVHQGFPVQAVVYNSDNSNGSVYSTSSGCMNCWKCGALKSKNKKSKVDLVQITHFHKNTGYRLLSMSSLPGNEIMVAAGYQSNTKTPALLSISMQRGDSFMHPKEVTAPPAQPLKVKSLHGVDSTEYSVAATMNNCVSVFDLSQGNFSQPKTSWTQREFLSSLQPSTTTHQIFCGSKSGEICGWDPRCSPQSNTSMKYKQRIISDLDCYEFSLFSGSTDGSILHWDLRKPAIPLSLIIPDSHSILCLKLSPQKPNWLGISTITGLYCLDTEDMSISEISPETEKTGYSTLDWNSANGILYACTMNGALECWQFS